MALATFRDSASIIAIVCSAVETVFPPGVFITTIPCRVAAGTSMLSTPTPARTITLSRGWSRSTSAVSWVPDRITIPSASARPARSAGGSSFVLTTTSRPGSARSSCQALFGQLVRHQYAMRHDRTPVGGCNPPMADDRRGSHTSIQRSHG